MISWRDRGRGGNSLDGGGVSNSTEEDVSLPLGPGEWEEALGLPLCVVCQNVSCPGNVEGPVLTLSVRPYRNSGKGAFLEGGGI